METQRTLFLSLMLSVASFGVSQAQMPAISQHPGVLNTQSSFPSGTIKADFPYEGLWRGSMRTPEGTQRVALDVAQRALVESRKGYVATWMRSGADLHSTLADRIEAKGDTLQVELKGGTFTGRLAQDGAELRGTWIQGGRSFPLTLKRTPHAAGVDRNGMATGSQSQIMARDNQRATTSSADTDGEEIVPPKRKAPALQIGPPHYFPWYQWVPPIGNQERPWGVHYW